MSVEPRRVVIGSTSQIAWYQEIGTIHIPPRPFLGLALNELAPELVAMIGERVAKAVAGNGV